MLQYVKGNDYGSLNSSNPVSDEYRQEPFNGQVYLATHNGGLRLPFMYRSFISFSFGGLNILDFGIIRVTEGERMQSNLYTDFLDLVEEYNVLHGQFYWGTHFKPLVLQYLLSTDGMTQSQLDKFKLWFAPTKTRLLIRAEHPNRGIMARVQEPPVMNMIGFEGRLQRFFNNTLYEVPTTLYKGDIKISFVCDYPFWYAIKSLIGKRYLLTYENGVLSGSPQSTETALDTGQFYQYVWEDANGKLVPVMSSGDALKIILLDNVLTPSMIQIRNNLFIGDDTIVTISLQGNESYSINAVVSSNPSPKPSDETTDSETPNGMNSMLGAHPGGARVGLTYAPAIIIRNSDTGAVTLSENSRAYLYYAGTAPSYTTLLFNLTPQLVGGNDIPYIKYPSNKYYKEYYNEGKSYNSITLTSPRGKKYEFRFTTPAIWNAYNQALYWFNKLSKAISVDKEGNTIYGTPWEDVKMYIRDNVTHSAARAYAQNIIDGFVGEGSLMLYDNIGTVNTQMKGFMSTAHFDKFIIDSKTGICIAEKQISPEEVQKENVGDMVRSNYLFLLEANHPNDKGKVDENCVYTITTDYYPELTEFSIKYKNMYY